MGGETAARGVVDKATIDDIEVAGRRVLVRFDFNVPMVEGRISDDRRIRESLPTLQALLQRGARVIAATHIGRPKGKVVEELRVTPVAKRLGELIGAEVRVATDVAGESAQQLSRSLRDGEVGMVENVRFEPGEESNDPEFCRQLAALADAYVNDAFGTAHRAHASTEGVGHILPAVAGYLMIRELRMLGGVMEAPRRPLVAIIGGAKISTKIGVLRHLLPRVDTLWVGGAMACTFYQALGEETGTSLVEPNQVDTARALLQEAHGADGGDLRLPVDVVIARDARTSEGSDAVSWKQIPGDRMVVDVGPDTVAQISESCANAGTVVWNGPLGIYEVEAFAEGTRRVAQALAESSAETIVGGGDLAAALAQLGLADKVTFISTGGGATLEFLEGRVLPGVAVLRDREG